MSVSPLSSPDRSLLRKLVLAVVFKLIVLVLLWWLFIHERQVSVDVGDMAAQMLHPHATAPAQGDSPSKE